MGVGALLLRPGLELAAQLHGGGQEGGRRAGSVPVPLVVGLGEALSGALVDQQQRGERLAALRDRLWAGLQALGGVELNGVAPAGAGTPRLAHNLNVTVQGVDGPQLHRLLRGRIAVSSGSACSQGSPSHVLAALGRSRQEAAASIRFGLGRGTSAADISLAIETVAAAVRELR
jgi:cysteine desulfurase